TGPLTDLDRAALLFERLLAPESVVRVGGIYYLDYNRALVITNDKWRLEAGGIPQHCFLLATAGRSPGSEVDDDEVLLLRVEASAQLAQERDLLAVREEAMRDMVIA